MQSFLAYLEVRKPALVRDRRGVTALEYGIIAGALAFVLVAVFTGLGTTLGTAFIKVGAKL